MEEFYKTYSPVYKLPSMGYLATLSRLKIYYGIGIGICSSACLVLDQMCVIDAGLAKTVPTLGKFKTHRLKPTLFPHVIYRRVRPYFISGVMFGIALCGATYFTNRLVGFIYLNNEGDTIMMSYLNFWGRRINQEIPIDDLMALSDLPSSMTDRIYLTLRRYSNTDTFKFNANQGIVLDKEKFQKVFGTKWDSK